MKRFAIHTLGCRSNQYESQAFRSQLQAMGLEAAEQADLHIINTCTVTKAAEKESLAQVKKLLKNNPQAKVVVTGCATSVEMEALGALVIPNKDKERLLEAVFPGETLPEFKIDSFEAHTRAFVKVQDGCNSYCTYCIIPYVRGRSRSRPIKSIVEEVRGLIEKGFKEVVLTGINIGDFDGGDGSARLVDLVKAIDELHGLQRLRLSSIDPDEVDSALQEAVLSGKNTCPSLHLVLQSGSNVVLKRMNRKYTRQVFQETVERLKQASPDFTVTTDVIVGFPGETDEDFNETLAIMKEVRFAKVHMFPYSVRERTRAALFPHKISPEVIQERKAVLQKLAEETAFSLRQDYLGREMSVLTEGVDGDMITGHTNNFLPVMMPKEGLQANMIVRARMKENTPKGLWASHSK